MYRIKQRRYIEDEETLANSGAFTLSNPLVSVKDEGKIVFVCFCLLEVMCFCLQMLLETHCT